MKKKNSSKRFGELATALKSNDFLRVKVKLALLYMVIMALMLALFNLILEHELKKSLLHFHEEQALSVEEAEYIASQYNPRAKVVQIKKERKSGQTYYEVHFSDNTEVAIDADAGNGGLPNEISEDPAEVFEEYLENALFMVNIIIIILAGFFSYFLAEKTLEPIAQKMEQQKRFTADAAHELRNPLAAMRVAAESVLRKKSIRSKESREVLETILEDTLRLSSLSEDLLTLLSSETSTKDFKKVNLKKIVEKVLDKLKPLADEKKISFKGTIKSFSLMGDERMLETLVFNLVHNAIKFSRKKGEIIVSLDINGEFTVRDFGIGIAPQHINDIFGRFYKVEKSRSSEIGGSGLGLSIVQEVARRHKADIAVSSNLGKGTLFKILF